MWKWSPNRLTAFSTPPTNGEDEILASIWIFNHYAGAPHNVPATRTYELAKLLNGLGWNVTVIACTYNHYTFRDDFADSPQNVITQHLEGVRWIFAKSTPYRGNGFARLCNMLVYAHRAMRWSRTQVAPDMIVGTSVHPFAAEAARRIARERGTPFVYEVTDLWPESLADLGYIGRTSVTFRILFRLESAAFRSAAGVVGLMPSLPRYAEEAHGRPIRNFCYVPNGIHPMPEGNDGRAGVPGTVAYAGGFARAHGLDVIVRAAHLLHQKYPGTFVFHMYGDGAERERLELEVERLGLSQMVLFHGLVAKSDLREHLIKAEILICSGENLPVHRFGVSFNKLFDYFDVSRPVVFSVNSSNDPVRESGAGVPVELEMLKGWRMHS